METIEEINKLNYEEMYPGETVSARKIRMLKETGYTQQRYFFFP